MDESVQDKDKALLLETVSRHLKFVKDHTEIDMEADLDGLGLDSMAALNLMLELEESFGIVFPESTFTEETFASPQALWQVLSSIRGTRER